MIYIIMSTYNGADYVQQQLDSILAQTEQDWQLLIRDDGSSDGTMQILTAYAESRPDKIRIIDNGGQNVGVVRSFELLLEQCSEADYVQLADQDDVWKPDKLSKCLGRMKEAEDKYGTYCPLIVHCDLVVTDSSLNPIAPSFWQYANIHPEILDHNAHYLAICNSAQGCAAMINHAAVAAVLPFREGVYMHDAWIGLKVLVSGGHIIALPEALMFYRQHDDNVIGAQAYRFRIDNLKEKLVLARQSYATGHPTVFHNKLHFLYWKTLYFIRLHLLS